MNIKCGEEILSHQQQYPMIFLSLKSAKQPNFEESYGKLCRAIAEEFRRHQYLLEGNSLADDQKLMFQKIMTEQAEYGAYNDALKFLSECLWQYHGKNTIILIDEYDVPLENAYFKGFYDKMIDFICSLFESALKTNPYLERGVITGCLRISKESIFTGLNNLAIESVLSLNYPGAFGFTEPEVKEMMAYFDRTDNYPELKRWYDGYCFGETEIYDPWSILNYLYMGKNDPNYLPRPYWSNTSSNSIIREMVGEADERAKVDLETLINGGTIEKQVHEDITYGDIHQTQDNLWNFLFFTGYLKKVGERKEGNNLKLEMKIPNIGGYLVRSNRESGNGRPDIVMTESKFRGKAMILELKISDTIQGMEKKCEEALTQIEEQKYESQLEEECYQPILKYAICFFKKRCMVKKAEYQG